MLLNQQLDPPKFHPRESMASLEAHWIEPEFGVRSFPLQMDMGWFLSVRRIKEESIRPGS